MRVVQICKLQLVIQLIMHKISKGKCKEVALVCRMNLLVIYGEHRVAENSFASLKDTTLANQPEYRA